ncbi:MAG: glycosyltransferase family 39 protein, partial [Herpetosiphonaceae bacterium]|nr:glycosyltransferase family 39 protein [Herpetosiphonaceae bacterium]
MNEPSIFQPLLPTTRRGRLALAGILLLALAVRLTLWSLPTHLPGNDENEYLAVARDLLAGRGWRFYDAYPWLRAPLYSLYLAGCLWLAGGDAQLALLPNVMLSVLHVYLLWMLGRAFSHHPEGPRRAERAGLWTAAAGATLLTLAAFANLWMSETLWNVLWALALLLLLRWRRTPAWPAAILAGGVIGLAILARSLPWLFLPILAAWMLWHRRGWRGLGYVAGLGLACLLVIAPWTLRNWRAYGAPILVETGFAYNLWAFSEPPLELGQINEILSAIPNPVERADYASAQGRALLSADPTILLRKPWPNTIYLWRVKPIQDRFIQQNYYSDVPLPYFISALIFDDLWYVALLALAAVGLGRAQRDGRLALALLWLGYVAGSTMWTHGEARYRHFFWPILLIYAGQTLARAGSATPRLQRFAAAAVGAGLLALIAANYPLGWAGQNLARGWQRYQASRAVAAGDYQQAEARLLQALEIAPSPDGWIALGRSKALLGASASASEAFRAAVNDKQDYPPATLALGAHLLATGQPTAAREAWANPYADQQVLLDWGWRDQVQPVTTSIAVGDGLDLGLVHH